MNMRQLCPVFAAAGLAGCATAAPLGEAPSPMGPTAEQEQEAIYSAAMGRAGLTARVNSNGCTKRSDFKVQVLEGYPAATVILTRIKPDLCRAFAAGGTDIVFSYEDMGMRPTASIVLANPLIGDPTPGR